MFLKLFRGYKIGKTIYSKILKPVYLELRKDAYALEDSKPNRKITGRKRKSKSKTKNA